MARATWSQRLRPLRSRPFRALFGASVVSELGDWLSYVAVATVAARDGEGPFALAFVFVAHLLPHAALAPFAGPLADRFDRRSLLVVADAARAVLTAGMAGAAAAGMLGLLQLLLFARVAVGAFAWPAKEAAVPSLVHHDDLGHAGALLSLTWSVVFALGVSVGGGLLVILAPAAVILVDAATFVIAGVLHATLPSLPPGARPDGAEPAGVGWRDVVDYLRARPLLLDVVLAKAPLGLAMGGGWLALNVVTLDGDDPGRGALWLGALHAVRAVGTGLGPLLFPTHRLRALLPTDLLTVVGVALVGVLGSGFGLALAVFAWGFGSGRNWVVSTALRQHLADDAVQGRLSSLDALLSTLAQGSAALVAAALATAFGPAASSAVLAALAALLVLARAVGGATLPRAPEPALVGVRVR